MAHRREHPVGRTLQRAAADDRRHGDDPRAPLARGPDAGPHARRPTGSARSTRSGSTGAITMTSAAAKARLDLGRRPGGVGALGSGPLRTVGSWWRWTKYSWNSSQPSSRPDLRPDRRRRSSAGCAPRRRASAAAAARCRSGARRARSRAVRATCVARSRSPSRNHVSSPYRASWSAAFQVSPSMPQPSSRFAIPASVYRTVSWSGQTRSPWRSRSSPVLTIDGEVRRRRPPAARPRAWRPRPRRRARRPSSAAGSPARARGPRPGGRSSRGRTGRAAVR